MSIRRHLAARHNETVIERLEAATEAVYNCALSDGDPLAVLIHNSDYVDAGLPIAAQLEQVKSICRVIAKAALDAADVGRS